MTKKQKDCIQELQDIIMSMNSVVEKHGLENEFIACIAVGFLDLDTSYTDEDGHERADMNLLSSFSVTDEEELDDLLSYCIDSYRIDKEVTNAQEQDTSSIDYWINLSQGDNSVN